MMLGNDPAVVAAETLRDRRGTSRFPIHQDVRYKVVRRKVVTAGSGRTLNIGSGGVFFTTEHSLPIGGTVEVSVNWPAMLDGVCPLKLVASGDVVRAEKGTAAVRIKRYEFRTRATRPISIDCIPRPSARAIDRPE